MIAGIIGGSGYTGRELISLLLKHPKISQIKVYGRREGVILSDEIPELKKKYDEPILLFDSKCVLDEVDVIFVALPHKISMENSKKLRGDKLLIDLSADYRLTSPIEYKKWYGTDHLDADSLNQYVYGLSEIFRQDIKSSTYIANPGCYPTAILLGLYPLLKENLIEMDTIIADAKSGHTGAGKKLSETLHAGQITDNIQPYKIHNHQHKGEILQTMKSLVKGLEPHFVFTPQVMPFDRGILASLYVRSKKMVTQTDLNELYIDYYKNEPFVRLFLDNKLPTLKDVVGSNFCDIAPCVQENGRMITIISVIDNLIKGASGQAIQNMNIAFSWDERAGLYV